MRTTFILPDGRVVHRVVAFHLIPHPNTMVDIEGTAYRVTTVDVKLTQDHGEAHVVLVHEHLVDP